jgi:hypothetical protein
MKLNFLISTLLSCLLLVLPAMSGTSYSQSQDAITKSKVLAILNSVDRASRKGNIAGIVAPLAKDVKIKMAISTPASDKEQVLNLNKAQYTDLTRRGMRRRLAYQLERKNTQVRISNDGNTATVTSDLYESLTVQQGTLRAVSSEVAILNLREGKLVVTSLEGRIRFY